MGEKMTAWSPAKRVPCLAMVVVLTGLGGSVRASTILVDFGADSSFRGVSVANPDPKGHYWNSIAPGAFVTNLVDIANHATTVDLGFDTPVGTDSFNGP